MVKTGLLLKAYERAAIDWGNYNQKENTPEAISFQDGLKKTLEFLSEVGKSDSPDMILGVEKFFSFRNERHTPIPRR